MSLNFTATRKQWNTIIDTLCDAFCLLFVYERMKEKEAGKWDFFITQTHLLTNN